MKKLVTISITAMLILLAMMPSARAQRGDIYGGESFYYDKSGFFIAMGYIDGPDFQDYINWANEAYPDTAQTGLLEDFGSGFCFSVGLRSRFSRYFAFEVDFQTASKKRRNSYRQDPYEPIPVSLDLTIASINFSVPVIFQFSQNQPAIPFVAAGVSVFPLRLDHRVGPYEIRQTKTALAGNFACGVDISFMSHWYITARADWTFGKANMPVTSYEVGPPYSEEHYEMDLSTTSIQIGVMRGLH